MYTKNYRPPDPKREGACSKDVWRIYNMLPYYTNFTLMFFESAAYYKDPSSEPLAYIDFKKCGNPLDPLTVDDHIEEMKAAFRRFGYSGYKNVLLDWRKGFGNVAIVRVVLDTPAASTREVCA